MHMFLHSGRISGHVDLLAMLYIYYTNIFSLKMLGKKTCSRQLTQLLASSDYSYTQKVFTN